ncbi:glutaredoxin family protein [Nakamurella antarctica]|uniref:glutaredoxin family protein n=1 Tax=Nakamurella antarctica TaxID=1902245 RepID=UPI003BB01C5C
MRLVLRLKRLRPKMINIWSDPDAAAFVRSVAGGNETVPTVVIDGRAVVNPAPSAKPTQCAGRATAQPESRRVPRDEAAPSASGRR